jgi:KDO2-lipid IV(A) lauroyltransferase
MNLLKEGGIAGILPDQSPGKKKANVFAPFFNIEVRTMTLVNKLIQKTDAKVVTTYAERLPDGRGFRIVVTEAMPENGDPDPVIGATAMNKSVEKVVRMSPEQYQWEYKRFRHRSDGMPSPYKS